MKSTPEDIKTRLLQGYDPEYFRSLYKQKCYAFGDDWNKRGQQVSTDAPGVFPDFPDITVRFMEIGRSRRILNSQFIGLSRSMGSDPSPEFPQLDKQSAEVRKQFYLARYGGSHYEGEWADEHAAAYMDGDGLGVGFVHFGLKTNPKTGFQYTTCEYSPIELTLYDRHERQPGRARWIAFAKYLAYDQAVSMFGAKVADHYKRPLFEDEKGISFPLEIVRVFDYYDIGMGSKGVPTRALIPGDLGQKPITIEENPFECLPFSHMTYFMAPGMRRATGRIVMQMATQEGLNELEQNMRTALKDPGFDIVDVTQLNAKDLARVNAGDKNVKVRMTNPKPDVPPYIRIDSREVAQTLLALKDHLERQFNIDSQVTDMERGIETSNDTLGQDQLLDQRSASPKAWAQIQATKMHRRSVEVALKIAEKFDRDPVLLDIFGKNILFNDPANPNSWMSTWLEEPSKVLIADDQLKARDAVQDRVLRQRELDGLAPLVQMGLISPQKFAEEKLKAAGEVDPGDWIPQAAPVTEMGENPMPSMVAPI